MNVKLKIQGDLYLVQVGGIPPKARPVKPEEKRFILRRGEATGHAHSVDAEEGVEVYEKDGYLYIGTDRFVKISHEEHPPLILKPGVWKVGVQREYDPFQEEERQKIRPIRD